MDEGRLAIVIRQEEKHRKFVYMMNDNVRARLGLYTNCLDREQHESSVKLVKNCSDMRRIIVRQKVMKRCLEMRKGMAQAGDPHGQFGKYGGTPLWALTRDIDRVIADNHPKVRRLKRVEETMKRSLETGAILDQAAVDRRMAETFLLPHTTSSFSAPSLFTTASRGKKKQGVFHRSGPPLPSLSSLPHLPPISLPPASSSPQLQQQEQQQQQKKPQQPPPGDSQRSSSLRESSKSKFQASSSSFPHPSSPSPSPSTTAAAAVKKEPVSSTTTKDTSSKSLTSSSHFEATGILNKVTLDLDSKGRLRGLKHLDDATTTAATTSNDVGDSAKDEEKKMKKEKEEEKEKEEKRSNEEDSKPRSKLILPPIESSKAMVSKH